MLAVHVGLDVGIVRIRLPHAVDDKAVFVSAGRNLDKGVMHRKLWVIAQWAGGGGPVIEIACDDDPEAGFARLNEANAVLGHLDAASWGVGCGDSGGGGRADNW